MLDLMKLAQEQQDYMVKIRRYVHENPELSSKEDKTIEFIAGELTKMNIKFVNVENGGLIAFMDGGKPGNKTVLLRADVDALPMQDHPENLKGPKVAVSKVDGACHACGHDAHIAMLLGATQILNNNKDEIEGKVVLLLERGEEATGNILHLLKYLEDNKIKIDSSYGIHTYAPLESGKISMSVGPVMAGVIVFSVKIIGRGGHGSRPDQSISPIDAFAALASSMHSIRMKNNDPFNALTFSIGYVRSGTVANIIPDTIEFGGTVRLYQMEDGFKFKEEFARMIENICAAYNCKVEYTLSGPSLPVVNHKDCALMAQEAMREVAPGAVVDAEPWMASESMSTILNLYPGVFAFVGINNPEKGTGAAHHNTHFDIDEDTMMLGAASAASYAINFLKSDIDTSSEAWDKGLAELYKYSNRPQKMVDFLEGKTKECVL